MPMVALSPELVEQLRHVVNDAREGFEAGVWAVNDALALHAAFIDTNSPRSALIRSIVVSEFRAAAERRGLYARTGTGGAVELYEANGNEYAVIRLRSAAEVDGQIRVIANSGSSWNGLSDDGLWRESRYVFGFMVNDHDSISFFVAEVIGETNASVAHLEFGWVHRFSAPTTGGDVSFTPDGGDSLDGWDIAGEFDIADEA